MTKEKKPKFETALKQLEETVRKLESGDQPLDQALKLFEEGMELANFCGQSLNEAQGQVEKLMQDAEGKKTVKPFLLET